MVSIHTYVNLLATKVSTGRTLNKMSRNAYAFTKSKISLQAAAENVNVGLSSNKVSRFDSC